MFTALLAPSWWPVLPTGALSTSRLQSSHALCGAGPALRRRRQPLKHRRQICSKATRALSRRCASRTTLGSAARAFFLHRPPSFCCGGAAPGTMAAPMAVVDATAVYYSTAALRVASQFRTLLCGRATRQRCGGLAAPAAVWWLARQAGTLLPSTTPQSFACSRPTPRPSRPLHSSYLGLWMAAS